MPTTSENKGIQRKAKTSLSVITEVVDRKDCFAVSVSLNGSVRVGI